MTLFLGMRPSVPLVPNVLVGHANHDATRPDN